MRTLPERAGLIGLAAFLVLDAVLVGLAINSTRGPVAAGGTTVGTAGVALPSGAGGTGGTGGPSSTPTTTAPTTTVNAASPAAVKAVPLTVGVTAVDGRTAFRFATGTCRSGGSSLELTRNGGATWGPRSVPFDALMRVRVRSDGSAFVVGVDSKTNCKPTMRRSATYDGEWGSRSGVGGAWYRDLGDPTRIGLPNGSTGKPCRSGTVVDLAVTDSGATALCSDGSVMASKTGSTWDVTASVPGALAVAVGPQNRAYLAVPGVGGCAGVAVVASAAPTTVLGCAKTSIADIVPGTVALSVAADGGWLVVGDGAFHSNAALGGWTQA